MRRDKLYRTASSVTHSECASSPFLPLLDPSFVLYRDLAALFLGHTLILKELLRDTKYLADLHGRRLFRRFQGKKSEALDGLADAQLLSGRLGEIKNWDRRRAHAHGFFGAETRDQVCQRVLQNLVPSHQVPDYPWASIIIP